MPVKQTPTDGAAFEVLEDVAFIPGVNALVLTQTSGDDFEETREWLTLGGNKIALWGINNDMPYRVKEKVERSEVLSAGMCFNTSVIYGQGIQVKQKKTVNGKTTLEECTNEDVLDFVENNDLSGYFLEQSTDMAWFYNVFPEIILSADRKKIVSLRSKEAMYSRWGIVEKGTGKLTKHFYCAQWDDNPTINNTTISDALDPYSPYLDLKERLSKGKIKEPRFILPISFPTPGKVYYQQAHWWSVFKSGWYDYATMLPEFKKALLRNGLAIKYIIYVSDKYWDIILAEDGISPSDKEAVKKRKAQEYEKFRKFVSGEKQAGKGIVATKKVMASGTSAFEEKYLVIETIKNDIKGGEFIEDSAEVSNIMSYAMGVQPSLIGSSPGKNNNSFSGTDKRELFMIKSALIKPYRDRMLRIFDFIKKFNNWPREIVFTVPDIEFTTLDENKSGQQEINKENAN
jgi:hypothetical protein